MRFWIAQADMFNGRRIHRHPSMRRKSNQRGMDREARLTAAQGSKFSKEPPAWDLAFTDRDMERAMAKYNKAAGEWDVGSATAPPREAFVGAAMTPPVFRALLKSFFNIDANIVILLII